MRARGTPPSCNENALNDAIDDVVVATCDNPRALCGVDNALGARHGALDVVKHCAGCNHIRSKAAATSRTDVETRDDDDLFNTRAHA